MVYALTALLISGFLSSTILPGTSEAGFLLFIGTYPRESLLALLLLSAANTLGSLTSFLFAWFIPKKNSPEKTEKLLLKYGTPLLFFSFLPLLGDALPLAAGWLKFPPLKCVFFIGLGKLARYFILMATFFKLYDI